MLSFPENKLCWFFSFLVSILLNLILLKIFHSNDQLKNQTPHFIELQIERKVSEAIKKQKKWDSIEPQVPSTPHNYVLEEEQEILPESEKIPLNPSESTSEKTWAEFVNFARKSRKFLSDSITLSSEDTSLAFLIPQFSADDLVPNKDPMGSTIYKHGSGGVGLRASQTKPIVFPEKEYPVQLNFTPEPVHVLIMSALYNQGDAHQNDIYFTLPDSISITAEGLDSALNYLYKKGLLTRKKISAEHKIIALFFPVEISKKNRRNPLYIYKPAVNKELLKIYINSLRKETPDTTKNFRIHRLVELLNL